MQAQWTDRRNYHIQLKSMQISILSWYYSLLFDHRWITFRFSSFPVRTERSSAGVYRIETTTYLLTSNEIQNFPADVYLFCKNGTKALALSNMKISAGSSRDAIHVVEFVPTKCYFLALYTLYSWLFSLADESTATLSSLPAKRWKFTPCWHQHLLAEEKPLKNWWKRRRLMKFLVGASVSYIAWGSNAILNMDYESHGLPLVLFLLENLHQKSGFITSNCRAFYFAPHFVTWIDINCSCLRNMPAL